MHDVIDRTITYVDHTAILFTLYKYIHGINTLIHSVHTRIIVHVDMHICRNQRSPGR